MLWEKKTIVNIVNYLMKQSPLRVPIEKKSHHIIKFQ